MKTPLFLAAALIAGMIFCPKANATAVDFMSTTVGPLGTADSGSFTIPHDPASNGFDTFTGKLNGNQILEINYSYTGSVPFLLDLTVSAAGSNELIQAKASTSDVFGTTPDASATMNSLPVFITAGFVGDPTGTARLANNSSTPISFSSIFSAAIFNATEGGETLVSFALSEVPLPPAVRLFSLGLLTFAAIGARKKAQDKA